MPAEPMSSRRLQQRSRFDLSSKMANASHPGNGCALYSTLADDPDLGDLVDVFVNEIPDRVAGLAHCLASGDWEGLGRLAHQFKSAVGSYGFAQLVPPAVLLDAAVREGCAEDLVEEALVELSEMCSRVRAGSPAGQSEDLS